MSKGKYIIAIYEGVSKSFRNHPEVKELYQWNFVSVITGPYVHYDAKMVSQVCLLSLQVVLDASNLLPQLPRINCKMEKIEASSVIKILLLKGYSAQKIYDEIKIPFPKSNSAIWQSPP